MAKAAFSLEGKVALITGGSRGIGKATALGFAQAGADVVVASRKLPDLEKVAEEIRKSGRRSLAVAAHVGKLAEIDSLVNEVSKEFGRIDILVNNAGGQPMPAAAIDTDERLWDVVMNLNLKGLFFLAQAVARVMREHGGGTIVNVASCDAFTPEYHIGAYAIAKAAVVMATKVMAREWAEYNIRVNALAPGNVHTRLGDSRFEVFPGYEQQLLSRTPLGRFGNPEDMVGPMIYLASDASCYTTGQTLISDGGFLVT